MDIANQLNNEEAPLLKLSEEDIKDLEYDFHICELQSFLAMEYEDMEYPESLQCL